MNQRSPMVASGVAVGAMVTPRIRLVRPLGQGGMGNVWVAEHVGLDTEVAVKFISAEVAAQLPGTLERFQREARLAAKIRSPHVVQTYDHGVMSDGRPFIVMELLEGESLGRKIEREGPLTPSQVELMLRQAAEVLSKAHSLGVVHRDIKPDNIYCIESAYELFVKILDFGIAKEHTLPSPDSMTMTGAMLGTPLYMSPEQVKNAKAAGPDADMWALAATAYQALTGSPPFNGETLGGLCVAIVAGEYERATTIRGELPAQIDDWFARAFCPEASQRFRTPMEMAEAFSACLRSQAAAPRTPVEGTPPPRPATDPPGTPATLAGASNTVSDARRRAIPAAGLGVAALVVLVLSSSGVIAHRVLTSAPTDRLQRGLASHSAALPGVSAIANGADPSSSASGGDATLPQIPSAVPKPNSKRTNEPRVAGARPAAKQPSPPSASKVVPSSPDAQPPSTKKPVVCSGDTAFVVVDGKLKVRPECR